MLLDRRSWLATTTALATSLTLQAAEDEKQAFPIVDTHQHLWDLSKFNLPWLGKDGDLSKNFVTKDYLAATEGLNIVKAVYMEVDVAEDQKEKEAEHIVALSKQKDQPTVAAVIGCRPLSANFPEYAKKFADQPLVKGFRQVMGKDSFTKQFLKNVQFLGEIDKSYDLCVPGSDLAATIKVVDACPETRFILDHCGNADVKAFLPEKRRGDHQPGHDVDEWKRSIEQLAKRKNLICKISGIIAGAPQDWQPDDLAPIVNHCLDSFGPNRVVFGSDWPVCLKGATLKQWVTALKAIIRTRPAEHQKQLLADNAIKFYGL